MSANPHGKYNQFSLMINPYRCICTTYSNLFCSFGSVICSWAAHYDDVTMSEIASRITSLMIVYSTVHSVADQSKHQSSASLAFVWEIHRWPVNFPHKWPVTRKISPFDDVIMNYQRNKLAFPASNSRPSAVYLDKQASNTILLASCHSVIPWSFNS